MKPLNGEKTHPLTPAAIEVLRRLERTSLPKHEINPGMINRLMRENLIELVDRPTPGLKKRQVHARLTDEGRRQLATQGA